MRWIPSFVYLVFAAPFACFALLMRINELLNVIDNKRFK